jgi:hypothetical protein
MNHSHYLHVLQMVPFTEMITFQNKDLFCVNHVLVICGPSWFILDRQFWGHPSKDTEHRSIKLLNL